MQKILVIEQEHDLREELVDLLLYERFQVVDAAGAQRGWELMLSESPDLVLCSVRLEGLDGYGLLQRVRQNPQTTLIPFLFLTARATPDDLRRAMNLGADDFLIKPVRSSDLLAAIRSRLERYETIKRHHRDAFGMHQRVLLHYFPHELFTPLNSLLGFARVLGRQRDKLTPFRLTEIADVMYRNALRLFHLLQNQLLYLELESQYPLEGVEVGQLRLEVSPQLHLIARERADYYRRNDDLQLHAEAVRVHMLEKHFQIVARELIDNAFKFSAAGTPVIVSARAVEGQLQLKVVNAGAGLSQEQIAQIGAFTQFDRQQREQQGIGMGLMLTRRLLQLYGCQLELDSVPERYTQAEVRIAAD